MTDMSRQLDYWTRERIERLERLLADQHNDVIAEVFLQRLRQCSSIEQKRAHIVNDLLPALRNADSSYVLWEGEMIPTHLTLRSLIQEFLHQDHITGNVPTNAPDTPEEAATLEQLARLLGGGKLASDVVIEDRGPR